jgi:FkbM family methyltransferase
MNTFHGSKFTTKSLITYLRGPDHPMKVRAIRWLLQKFYPDGLIITNHLGVTLLVKPTEYIGWEILSTGTYEGNTLNLAADILKDGGIFLDIGANFGLWSCYLGIIPEVECLSIEPFAREFLRLQQNIQLNPTVKAKLFNLALDNSNRILDMEDFIPGNSGTVRVLLNDRHPSSYCHTVASTTLQNILSHSGIQQTVHLMKIDVEGYEIPILEGLDWQGSFRPRNIITEFTDYSARAKGEGRSTLFEFLTDRGYQGFTIDGKLLSPELIPLEDNAWFRDTIYNF